MTYISLFFAPAKQRYGDNTVRAHDAHCPCACGHIVVAHLVCVPPIEKKNGQYITGYGSPLGTQASCLRKRKIKIRLICGQQR